MKKNLNSKQQNYHSHNDECQNKAKKSKKNKNKIQKLLQRK